MFRTVLRESISKEILGEQGPESTEEQISNYLGKEGLRQREQQVQSFGDNNMLDISEKQQDGLFD